MGISRHFLAKTTKERMNRFMATTIISHSPAETESLGAQLAKTVHGGQVVALYGDMGMGKTVFVRGMASVLSPSSEAQSPTFALVHVYPGKPDLVHFDMYRITGWEDLYSTDFFEYIDAGAIVVTEWSENIEAALPEDTIRIRFTRLSDNERSIEMEADL